MGVIEVGLEFLSTFPRRERHHSKGSQGNKKYFYPRSHVGNDRCIALPAAGRRYFYPRSHVGNDPGISAGIGRDRYFYPRSHVGNDAYFGGNLSVSGEFLSTFPRRERPASSQMDLATSAFLSTFPRRERHSDDLNYYYRLKFLSTFPRRERLIHFSVFFPYICISIHVPT